MKILLFTNTDWSQYNFRVPLALELQKKGHEIVMASPPGEFVPKIEEQGFRHREVKISRTGMNPVSELKAVRSIQKVIKEECPDVVHNFTPKGVLYGSTAAKLCKVPTIVSSITGLGYLFENERKGLKYTTIRKGIAQWYKKALAGTQVIFQNAEDRQLFIDKKLITPENATLIKSSGVSIAEFALESHTNGVPVISLAARMVKAKGVETFVEAAKKLKSENINARFVLAGFVDHTRKDAITEEQIIEWEKQNIVEGWGFQDNMPEFYSQTDIVCLPSFGKEGVPRSLIEAAAAGKPIVTTDHTGCRDAVIDGETGYLVPVKDADKLAERLKKLILDEKLRKEMGAKAREFAIREFSIEQIAEQTERVYLDGFYMSSVLESEGAWMR